MGAAGGGGTLARLRGLVAAAGRAAAGTAGWGAAGWLFGAPVGGGAWRGTAAWAALMAAFTALPAVWFGLPARPWEPWRLLVVAAGLRSAGRPPEAGEAAAVEPARAFREGFCGWAGAGAALGAWAGAGALVLDWQAWWQAWPLPCCAGAILGFALGAGACLVRELRAGRPGRARGKAD